LSEREQDDAAARGRSGELDLDRAGAVAQEDVVLKVGEKDRGGAGHVPTRAFLDLLRGVIGAGDDHQQGVNLREGEGGWRGGGGDRGGL
jgi:hypothetical protein